MRELSIRTIVARPFETVRRWTGDAPADLAIVTGFVVLAATLLSVVDVGSPLVRAGVGFPLLFLAPGYATVAALFPRSSPVRAVPGRSTFVGQTRGIADVERAALSFGLSLALLPLVGLGIAVAPWGFTQPVVVGAVSGFALVGAFVAAVRRSRVPPSQRYRIDLDARFDALRGAIFETDSRAQTAVNLLLVCSTVLAATTVGYALAAPQDGERYTNVQLVTETGDGDYVAAEYPETFTRGEPEALTLELENREGRETDYEIVAAIERVDTSGGSPVVLERQELDRFELTLEDGETRHHSHGVAPETIGEDLRLSYFLYVDDAPDDVSAEGAYDHVYLWVDVDSGEE